MTSKTTDSNGEAKFNNLVSGDYNLNVVKSGYLTHSDTVTITDSDISKTVNLYPSTVSVITWDASIKATITPKVGYLIIGEGGGTVDYGDGTIVDLPEGRNTLAHTYTDTTKTYNIILTNFVKSDDGCFEKLESITSVSIPNVTYFGISSFDYCYGLKTVYLPDAITMKDACFGYCTGLTTILLEKATHFHIKCFWHCTNLKTVMIPSATEIMEECFYDCPKLEKIYFGTTTPPTFDSLCFDGMPSTTVIYCPTGCKTDYETAITDAGYSLTVMEYEV